LADVTSTFFTSLYESIPEDSRTSMRALVGDVLYLGDRRRRCAVEHRLASALDLAARERRPVVLVAHSLGSLVSYRYLRADRAGARQQPAPAIHRYVTLGSMLGIPELQELLLGHTGPLALSPGVRSWVNVRHDDDPFAVPLTDSAAGHERPSPKIRELVTISTTADPHDIVGYLRDPAAARAIAWAWCDAFKESRARAPAACGDVRDVE
jgi:alpha-beta hydrolase superfamily lysophospholipase